MKRLLILLFLTSCTLLHAQVQEPTMIFDSVFRYFEGTEEPPAGWNQLGFNYTDWDSVYSSQFGPNGIIGYGYENNTVEINPVTSLYTGINFYVPDKEIISDLFLYVLFDDGYVAYINGIEVARMNLGHRGDVISYNSLAQRSTNIVMYRQPLAIYLDEEMLDTVLNSGQNVISFQVHNDSHDGNDLGLIFGLDDQSGQPYNIYAWYGYKQLELDSSLLPIVKIEMDTISFRSYSDKYSGTMQIIYDSLGYNNIDDTTFDYNGNIGIEIRGQSSSQWPKKNYSIETRDSLGENLNIPILGMPRENDWILHGPISDRSLIRNALSYTLSGKLRDYAPRGRFVDLIFNGEYHGVYFLLESIKRDRSRVDIKKLDEDADDITGGYIMKWDKGPNRLQIVYPKDDKITDEQREYITSFYRSYEESIRPENLLDPENGYRKYIARPSFIDFTIINELAKNCDAYRFSTYMYKDIDSIGKKLHYGPVWDFDLAYGNSSYQEGNIMNEWQFDKTSNSRLAHTSLFQDTALVDEFQARWHELRAGPLMLDSIFHVLDSLHDYIGDAAIRNFQVWPMEGRQLFPEEWGFSESLTYEAEYQNLRNWIETRVAWIDNNIDDIYYPYIPPEPEDTTNQDTTNQDTSTSISSIDRHIYIVSYPNPVVNILSIAGTTSATTELQVEIINLFGQILKRESFENIAGNTFDEKINVNDLSSGMYYVKVYSQNKLLYVEQIVKR